MSLNRWQAIGRIGSDITMHTLQSGSKCAKFSFAVDESYKDKQGQKVESTLWVNCLVWNAQAEIAEKWLRKGLLIYAEGKLSIRQYEDKDGQKKYATEIVLNNFQMLERSDSSPITRAANPTAQDHSAPVMGDVGEPPTDDQDLPF